MFASVVIPTHNRKGGLLRTLSALEQQTYPADQFEVLVVDDGSQDGTYRLAARFFTFSFALIRQANAGATVARNHGARRSRGEILVFLDDDIALLPGALENLLLTIAPLQHGMVMGTLLPALPENAPRFARIAAIEGWGAGSHPETRRALPRSGSAAHQDGGGGKVVPSTGAPSRQAPSLERVAFTECKTGLLAVRRDEFMELGLFQDPTGGWPNWDDIDFGVRAYQAGYDFYRCPQAAGSHYDASLSSLKDYCLRSERASYSAVRLFERYPDLIHYLPMFKDKRPISLRDPLPLTARKAIRTLSAWGPVLRGMELLARGLERQSAPNDLLLPLYRWINSSYLYRGYRRSLNERARILEGA